MTLDTVTNRRNHAETAAIERLFNAYLRESGVFDPTVRREDGSLADLPQEIVSQLEAEGLPMRVKLPATAVEIVGSLTYFSAFGHHRYGHSLWLLQEGGEKITSVASASELAQALLNELAEAATIPLPKSELVETLLSQVENSVQKTNTYVAYSLREGRSLMQVQGIERFFAAEQAMVYGHPFHPTPKSSQGFTAEDMTQYAPELGASFALHYFAGAPEIVREVSLTDQSSGQDWIPAAVCEAAKSKLTAAQQHYRLLPCHPWQAAHVKTWPIVQSLLESGLLVDLGPLGDKVYPTSSVRTVWDPNHSYFFKLPLNVRITNFIRVNPLDQLERTMDASRVIQKLAPVVQDASFTILQEAGYRTIAPQAVTPEEREKLIESFGAIFRENPVVLPLDKDVPIVVASALEEPPHAACAPIMDAVRESAKKQPQLSLAEWLDKWLRQYLDISLLPLLRLFVRYGVSMEAHVQNSMVAFRDGWPVHFYVRDLEGVSISKERAQAQDMFGQCLDENSPVLYPEEEAWSRFHYYVMVNHVGHLISTLAHGSSVPEEKLWAIVGDVIRSADFFQEAKAMLEELLETETLPAKANFISSFQRRGERPLYVPVPNPLAQSRRKV
ncbi:IucA/IucC family protein [Brevibacillus sp. SAFN-007a]|uniref:IucA/IucC family protein n=1 Tax=Brevibacillus sp. SAFN-007a TaxID=3436862 RepID=UPI003F7E638D